MAINRLTAFTRGSSAGGDEAVETSNPALSTSEEGEGDGSTSKLSVADAEEKDSTPPNEAST